MQVTVSVFGRFHAFYLAHQLQKRGHLQKLITTYPKFEVEKYGIPRAQTISLVHLELMKRTWNRTPRISRPDINLQAWFAERFDKAAARRISPTTDLFVGWSSFSEQSIFRAKSYGAVTVVERGSAHIETQCSLLKEEYERFGLKPRLPHPAIIEKEKREYDLADYISIPSEFVARSFMERGIPGAKLIKSAYGVDLRHFQQLPKEDDVFRVIYAGTMSLQKGVHYLLKAFSELKLPEAELWLIGGMTPEIEPFLEKYAGTYRYLGFVRQHTLHKYYSQSSLFAICSIQEGLAMVQPQAMACGLPLLCTTNTGGEDLIDDGKEGFVIPIRDVEAIKEKILFFYENPDYGREMGQAAKRKVQKGLTWDDYGDKLIDTYQRICQY